MTGGIWWNLRSSCLERYILDIHLMFLSREIDIKLCQNYTKTYMYLYNSCSIKQIIFSKYATNLKTTISHSLKISDLLLFVLDIIDNIITYSLYSSFYVTRTSTNGSAVYWLRDTDGDMWQRYYTAIGGSSGNIILTI